MSFYLTIFVHIFHCMNNIRKSKIFWTNVIGLAISLLGLLNPEILTGLGFENNGKFLTIIGLITAVLSIIFRTFFNTPTLDPYVKIGGRPRRDKKPTGILPDRAFVFAGNDFTDTSEVYFSIAPVNDEYPLTIDRVTSLSQKQHVRFVENIEFTNIEELTFYIY